MELVRLFLTWWLFGEGFFCSRVSGLEQTEGVTAVREWRFRGGVMRVVAVTEDRSAARRWETPGRDRDS